MIKWKYKPNGWCPVQAEGWFLGTYFYFRSRWDEARIEFADSEDAWNKDDIKVSYLLYKTKPYKAGYLNKFLCTLLIYKGCFMYFFKIKQKD
jgi:hypothetical protein